MSGWEFRGFWGILQRSQAALFEPPQFLRSHCIDIQQASSFNFSANKNSLFSRDLANWLKYFQVQRLTVLVKVRIVRIFRCYGSTNFEFFKKQITDKCECLMVSHCDKNKQEKIDDILIIQNYC